MLRINREAIKDLPADQRDQALAILTEYESALKANPLLGYQPHPKQVKFHTSREPLKAFLGGNRSGKTTAGILDDLIQCVDRSVLPEHLERYKRWEPPFYCRIIVPDFTSTLEGVIFQKLREWAPKSQLVGDRFDKAYEKSTRKLSFKNGSSIDFLTFEQDLDKFGGAAKHRIHYDEEPPKDIRRESMMRLIDYGGDELFTMTPLHGMSWMYDEIWEPWTKGTLAEATLVLVDMDDNPYLDARTKKRALAGLTNEEREARKSGKFVHFAGMIYDEFSRNFHVIPEISTETGIPPIARTYVGIDPGMRHMAAILWAYLTPEDTMVVFDELALQGHNVAQVCEAIKLVNQKWGQRTEKGAIVSLNPEWYVIDPAARNVMHNTGRSDQMEYTKNGIVTILGQNSKTAGISAVKQRLQTRRLLVTANCQQTIDQFRKYRWKTPTRSEDDPKEEPVKKDDHLLDALRYVVMSMPQAPQQAESEEVLTPLERAMREDIRGVKRKSIAKTQFGGIYA
jgi:phage terminase large subunit-like protein